MAKKKHTEETGDRYTLYDDLETYDVTVTTEENVTHNGFTAKVTRYSFGPWIVKYTSIQSSPDIEQVEVYNPTLWMCIYDHMQYDSTHPESNRYKYDIYIATKNKTEGKPWLKLTGFGPGVWINGR